VGPSKDARLDVTSFAGHCVARHPAVEGTEASLVALPEWLVLANISV
jgi:hypothetical protein